MSVGSVGDGSGSSADAEERLPSALAPDEEMRRSWTAADARWANERGERSAPTAFVATDRRLLFSDGETAASVAWDEVRAVETTPVRGSNLRSPLLASGGLGLLTGLVVASGDAVNGVGLIVVSVALLVAGSAAGDPPEADAEVTVVVGDESERLTFSTDEETATALDRLARES